jgi:stage II sporulation protein AB (anti-sigma F factor)
MSHSDPRSSTHVLSATPAAVGQARQFAVEFAKRAGAPEAQCDAIRLAVSEAVTNGIIHGYRSGPGEIKLTLGLAGDELWVLVTDNGCGPQTAPESAGLGWGLALIADASDGFVIAEGARGGTEVQMRFRLAGNRVDGSAHYDSSRGSSASAVRPAAPTFSTTTKPSHRSTTMSTSGISWPGSSTNRRGLARTAS